MSDHATLLAHIDIAAIACAAHQAFYNSYGPPQSPLISTGAIGGVQKYVDVSTGKMSTQEIIDRCVAPMASALAGDVPRGHSFRVLSAPQGVLSHIETRDGISVRAIAGMRSDPILDEDGEVIGFDEPSPVIRLDVLTVAP